MSLHQRCFQELFAKPDPDKPSEFILGEDTTFVATFKAESANSKLKDAVAALAALSSIAKQVCHGEAHNQLMQSAEDAIMQCKGEINRAALLALLANAAFRQAQRGKSLRDSARSMQ